MKKRSNWWLVFFLTYVLLAVLLTLAILRRDKRERSRVPDPKKVEKPADRLAPSEWFYLDRNYPQASFNEQLFQSRKDFQMARDARMPRSRRGLDHPWTLEGPGNIGGRVNTIAVHPNDENIMYIGYSQGGVYRTRDGGLTWVPVFDGESTQSIAHVVIDPHSPDKIWVATGDVNISGYPHVGSGLYRSDDGGDTWLRVGLSQTGVLSKVVIDPFAEDIIYAGSMGYPSAKGDTRGLFRSSDGGLTWMKTLTIDDSTGVIDLVADPSVPGRVYASGWTRLRTNKIGTTLGPGTSLYRSDDYGITWSPVTNGLPEEIHSRTSLEITLDGRLFMSYIGPVNSGACAGYTESLQRIYVSGDGGMSWDTIPAAPANGLPCEAFGQFGWYFEALKVNPENPAEMYVLGVDLWGTLDGGQSWFSAAPGWWTYAVHADKHDLVFAHGRKYLGTDGGAYRTNALGEWEDIENIPSTQFYRATWNPHAPELYTGGAQDNGTTWGNGGIFNEWPRLLGGDGFQPLFDPAEPAWMYALTQYGFVWFNDGQGFSQLVDGLQGTRYWDMPLVMSPQDSKILYCGSSQVCRIDMRDTQRVWIPISPDLTRGQVILGNRYPAITAIAQSPVEPMRLYAGTQDGLLWTTPDGGLTWENITSGTPGSFVTSIACSTLSPTGVYVTYSGYRDGDHSPYIYFSLDAGEAWTPLAGNLPAFGVNNLMLLPETGDQVLLIGTDGGVYVSFDTGMQWERVGSGMPYMPVYDVDYNSVTGRIIAATFSRGIMTFPVEELEMTTRVDQVTPAPRAISIFPTVVTDRLTLQWQDLSTVGQSLVAVYDLSGRIVWSSRIRTDRPAEIELPHDLPSGLYMLFVERGGNQRVARFIKA